MPAINKHQAQRSGPSAGSYFGSTYNRDDRVFNPRIFDGLSKFLKGVHPTGLRVKKIRIKIFLTGLLFLGTAMVVDGK
jgi:hypothetical protein